MTDGREIRNQDLGFEVTRFLFNAARQYIESFDVYGENLSFEWQLTEGDDPVLHTGGEKIEKVKVPDYAHLLPEPTSASQKSGGNLPSEGSNVPSGM